MRSRLQPHRQAILDALAAGTSKRALARTYGVDESTLREFLGRKTWRAANPLRACQHDTLRHARNQRHAAAARAEEAYS